MTKRGLTPERIAQLKQLAPSDVCICRWTMDENGNVYHNGRCNYRGQGIPKKELPYEDRE